MRIRKAQSILEYICVAFVFATVGIASFLASNRAAILSARGEEDSLEGSIIAEVLEGGTPEEGYLDPEERDDTPEVPDHEWSEGNEAEYIIE